jgi:2'-5' RNA ligase
MGGEEVAMRLFVAIDIPPEIAAAIDAVKERLITTRADVRWLDAAQYHITVKFIGEVDEPRVPELLERVERAAGQVPAFELEVEGIDRLPQKGPARVIMSRILSPDQRITKLHRLVDSAVGGMGLPLDTRVLVPHLTLGRVKTNHGVNRLLRLIEKHDLDFFGNVLVSNVCVYRSMLGAGEDGSPRYECLRRAPLQQTPVAENAS